MFLRGRFRGRHRNKQRGESRVDQIDARKKMQNTLVDAQRRDGEAASGICFDEAQAAQGPSERAPMRIGKHGERQPKCGSDALRAALGFRTPRSKRRVHLDARAEQKDVALERCEAKDCGQLIDGSRRLHIICSLDCHRLRRLAGEPCAKPRKLRGEKSLVGRGPIRLRLRVRRDLGTTALCHRGHHGNTVSVLGGVKDQFCAVGATTPSTTR